MKISRIYSNLPKVFEPIDFVVGLNVVVAEIRLPENKDRDTHNLGKSTLGRLIDFLLLTKKSSKFFLFKHEAVFQDFVFFAELELSPNRFLTIRRSVKEGSKASFKISENRGCDYSSLEPKDWDHYDIAFEKSKLLLDGYLAWDAISPWTYRNVLGYFLRTQEDYQDVFQLRKFAGAHSDWKPLLAHILGFNAEAISAQYSKEEDLSKINGKISELTAELEGDNTDVSTLEGLLQLKRAETTALEKQLEEFDFRTSDDETSEKLVSEIDIKIAALNSRKYSLSKSRKRVQDALEEDRITFSIKQAEELLSEAKIVFEGQLRHDYEQLIDFNKKITKERRGFLKEELSEIDGDLSEIKKELAALGNSRSEALSYLSETQPFEKYKELSASLVDLRTEIESLEAKKERRAELQSLKATSRKLEDEKRKLDDSVETDVTTQNTDDSSLFSKIRRYFDEIVYSVVGRHALLSVSANSESHLEFRASFLDAEAKVTSADAGSSYKRLLCVAFDLSVLRAHLGQGFPRFAFHDGVFETLDPRKKQKLLHVLREYSNLGLQLITTTIDTELPQRDDGEGPAVNSDEIILTLHDEGQEGRLFKMSTW
ncbi:DUF2326 domain-containing protein [Celeribacter halophilus]|uniref:DUF2326 domain-containing protein n=1 Tax=Celeribacter halophilus TaxID=576117 RepID=UPI003A9150C1